MMESGYKPGSGLGNLENGTIIPIQSVVNEDRLGLKAQIKTEITNLKEISKEEYEIRTVEESPEWFECSLEAKDYVQKNLSYAWIVKKQVC